MAQQPFTIGILKQITDQYDAGEISYGKMVEMLNEVAMKWHNSTISKTETVKTMAQQTAVNWLLKSMHKVDKMDWDILFMRAVEMEKEQIMKAFSVGDDCGYRFAITEDSQQFNSAEQYYNEKYNK